jgi:outer membrane protein
MRLGASRGLTRLLAVLIFGLGVHGARAADLMDLYAKATEFDPIFQAARLEHQVAEQSLREAKAQYKPTLSGGVEATWVSQDIRSSDNFLFQEGTADYFNNAFSISLVQPIYQPEALSRIPQAHSELRKAVSELAAAEQDLIFRVAQAHFNVLATKDNLDFASAERMAIWQLLQESEQRLGSGLGTLTDVHDARARFALAQAAEIDAQDALVDSQQALTEITGAIPDELRTLSETFPLVEPDLPDVDAWVEAALFQNPTVIALQAAAEMAEREIRRQRAAYRPRLDLVASYDDQDSGGNTLGGGGGTEIATTDVLLRLGIPIFDSGRTAALVRAAALRHQIAVQDLERARRRLERETRSAFQGTVSGITRVQALSQSVFSQESAVSAKEEGLRSGLNTGLDVLDARRDLYLARRDLAEARYLYILNSLRLKLSAGILQDNDLRQIDVYLQ